ncbi:ArfGap-domain-containing protein [Sarocladium strictum]
MSRRAPNPAAERAAQNQATLKSLLKLETNKTCADCKRNKHPRWASWNLGVFVCIRCSGIHRGMGTHISRVKSVDLDSWTEEQMKSILSWGNARANKYWEAKLAPGHAPSESKIENFIRTKYELKRWTMDGPIPDPSTLDVEGDDDVPLNIVKEKQAIERSTSTRAGGSAAAQPQQQRRQAAPVGDLIGGDDPIPQRSSTAGPTPGKLPPPKAEPAPPKATNKDSLLGLDFLGESTAPPRPSSAASAGAPGPQSRPDLKQSILSLYASAPRPQVQQQQSNASAGSFGGMGSPTAPTHQQQGSFGGFNDAFSSLSMNSTTSPKPAAADPFASFGSTTSSRSPPPPSNNSAFGNLGGGSFFDTKPSQPPGRQTHQKQPSNSGFGDFGGFSSQPAASTKSPPPTQSFSADLLSLDSAPPPQAMASPPPPTMSPPASSSVFNLSSPPPQPAQVSPPINPAPPAAASSSFATAGLGGADVWGGNAWGSADTASTPSAPAPAPAQTSTTFASNDFGGWGAPAAPAAQTNSFASTPIVPGASGGFSPAPKVQADEEFGGWSSSTGQTGNAGAKPATGGFSAADDDLFNNVWG